MKPRSGMKIEICAFSGHLVKSDDAEDPGSIPELGISAGEGIGYPLQYSWASFVVQLVKNPPTV